MAGAVNGSYLQVGDEELLSREIFRLAGPCLNRASQRRLDRKWEAETGLPSLVLMEQAAAAAFHYINRTYLSPNQVQGKEQPSFLFLCGFGKNAGDAWALARQLRSVISNILILDLAPDKDLGYDANRMRKAARRLSLRIYEVRNPSDLAKLDRLSSELAYRPDYIVDGILGTGFKPGRPANSLLLTLGKKVQNWRAQGSLLWSLDIPSYLACDTGQVGVEAIPADLSLSFVLPKQANFLPPGVFYSGQVVALPIGIPTDGLWAAEIDDRIRQITPEMVTALAPCRREDSHKGDYGRGLLLAGSPGMPGGLILAASSALRSGLAYLYIAGATEPAGMVAQALPEALYPKCDTLEDLQAILARVEVVALGPAWGQSETKVAVLSYLLEQDLPLVVDADGLNLLAKMFASEEPKLLRQRLQARAKKIGSGKTLLTPHPGEFSRLAPDLVATLSPVEAAQTFARESAVILLLKGSRSLLALPDGRVLVSPLSCSGLARAGSGDSLTGLILSLAGQGLNLAEAGVAATYIQVRAGQVLSGGDLAGERTMRINDLPLVYPEVFRELAW